MARWAVVLVPLALLATSVGRARADEGASFDVDGKDTRITYQLVHKLHKVEGVSRHVEGTARLLPTGRVQVMLRVPVDSFDSGNVNRDAHMKETVEAVRFPGVEVKAIGDGVVVPATFPSTVETRFKVEVTLHGVAQRLEVPVRLIFDAPDRVRATASFAVSIESFGIKRPSLLFVKVDDQLRLDARVTLLRQP